MKFVASALLALPLALASPLAKRDGSQDVEGPTPFIGKGIIGLYHDTDGEYMGCATSNGYWTVDVSQCATFTGTTSPLGTSTLYHISTELGTCGTTNLDNQVGVFFTCGEGKESDYGVLDLGKGSRLFTGDLYMTYTHGHATYPQGDEAISLQLYGAPDDGKRVQMGWNATTTA